MADDLEFNDSTELSRLVRKLQTERAELAEKICSGRCTPNEYIRECATLNQIDATIENVRDMRRPTATKKPEPRGLPNVED